MCDVQDIRSVPLKHKIPRFCSSVPTDPEVDDVTIPGAPQAATSPRHVDFSGAFEACHRELI